MGINTWQLVSFNISYFLWFFGLTFRTRASSSQRKPQTRRVSKVCILSHMYAAVLFVVVAGVVFVAVLVLIILVVTDVGAVVIDVVVVVVTAVLILWGCSDSGSESHGSRGCSSSRRRCNAS